MIVRVGTSRRPTNTAPSWSRYSKAPKAKNLSFTIGPPNVKEYCCRSKGGAGSIRSYVAGRPCKASSRAKNEAEPRRLFEPDLVTTFIIEEPERPYSAENRFVVT